MGLFVVQNVVFLKSVELINLHHIFMKHEVMLNHENKGKLNIKQSTVWLTVNRRKNVGCAPPPHVKSTKKKLMSSGLIE